MGGHLLIGGIQIRLVAAGMADRCLAIVGNKQGRRAAQKLQRTDVRTNPGAQILIPGGFGIGVVAGAQDGNEDGRFLDRPGLGIDDRDGVSRIIDKQFFSGAVLLPQHQIQLAGPLLIQLTEPAVLVTVGIGLLVLLPNQLQRDMLVAVEIFMDGGPIRQPPAAGPAAAPPWETTAFPDPLRPDPSGKGH